MRPKDWIVTKNATRPAGMPDECFYCREKMGASHKASCVLRDRTVLVKVSFSLVWTQPESFDEEMIEFVNTGNSICASNLLDTIEKVGEGCLSGCMCRHTNIEVIREATKEDEHTFGFKWDEHSPESQVW